MVTIAGKAIRGITIEISGETTGLQKALKSVDSTSVKLNTELKQVNKLLKFNPKDTTLVAQKQELLTKAVDNTTKKLDGLKEAQSQVQAQFEKGEIAEEQYRAFQREISETEQSLASYQKQLNSLDGDQARLETNQKRLNTLFEATGTTVDDYADILGKRLTESIKNGTASADDMEIAINKIGRASLGNEADVNQLKEALDKIDDGDSIDQVRSEIEKMGNSSEDATEKVSKLTEIAASDLLMKAADYAKEASDKIIEIGQAGIESAANMQAAEAQFEQVFGEIQGQAQKTAESLGEELGMVPNRIKPGLSQMTSMFKGLGYDTEEALGMAERAVRSSADAASFWDKSYEDANGSLSSFLKGNYEAGESVGIFANDSQMAAFAITNGLIPATEGAKEATEKQMIAVEKAQVAYSKAVKKHGEGSLQAREAQLKLKEAQDDITESTGEQAGKWKDLDEATKQAVRLEYIENMQKMSEQTGQAAREMDGYENVMGNMSSVTDEFMSAIGDEALAMFIDIAQSLIPIIQSVAQWIQGLNPVVKQFFTLFAGGVAIVGLILPVLAGLGAAAAGLGITIGALFTTVILPAIGIVAAIAAAITAAILVFKNWGAIVDWLKGVWSAFSSWIVSAWGNISSGASQIWSSMGQAISGFVSSGVAKVKSLWSATGNTISSIWNSVKSTASSIWNGITNSISNSIQNARNRVTSTVNGIKSTVSSVFSGVRSIASSTWNNIKNAIVSPIQAARNTVQGIVNRFKSMFNFKIKFPTPSIPKIKLPRFTISGSFNPLKLQVPKLGISWFAKGGILTKPTVFGQNGNNLMAGGEAGREAVLPLNKKTLGMIGQGIVEAMGINGSDQGLTEFEMRALELLQGVRDKDTTLEMDGRTVAKLIAKFVKEENDKQDRLKNRQRGIV